MKQQLGEVSEIKSGRGFKKGIEANSGGINVVQMSDVSGDERKIDWSKTLKADVFLKTHKSLENGDVLFLSKGKTNKAILVDDLEGDAVATHQFFILKPQESVNPEYLTGRLNSVSAKAFYSENAHKGPKQHLTKTSLSTLSVYVPPVPKQKELMSISNEVQNQFDSVQKDFDAIQNIYGLIFDGKLDLAVNALQSLIELSPNSVFIEAIYRLNSSVVEQNLKLSEGDAHTHKPTKLI
jgi:restriction endonuclease S subunit